ncbi:MAG TPA: hypothetical protein VL742_08095 [Casimicrobiaceae bacterium]|nr:hypothetical protein [Casimicrobiaceae bacterium]
MSHSAKNRTYLAIIAVLLIVIAATSYKFIVAGSTAKSPDGRVAIVLEPGERDLTLREMRDFLAGVQTMADRLAHGDMHAVAAAARGMGMARTHDVPTAMMGKLPLGFKSMALGVHQQFDTIAADAAVGGDSRHTHMQLSDVLRQCVACHAAYRVAIRAGSTAAPAHD